MMGQTYIGTVATRRYLDLVWFLADKHGRTHGWKTFVADKLGVSPGLITKLSANPPQRRVGADAITRARDRLGLGDYFETVDDAAAGRILRGDASQTTTANADNELDLMNRIASLDAEARGRVVAWARSRWGL